MYAQQNNALYPQGVSDRESSQIYEMIQAAAAIYLLGIWVPIDDARLFHFASNVLRRL